MKIWALVKKKYAMQVMPYIIIIISVVPKGRSLTASAGI